MNGAPRVEWEHLVATVCLMFFFCVVRRYAERGFVDGFVLFLAGGNCFRWMHSLAAHSDNREPKT